MEQDVLQYDLKINFPLYLELGVGVLGLEIPEKQTPGKRGEIIVFPDVKHRLALEKQVANAKSEYLQAKQEALNTTNTLLERMAARRQLNL